MKFMHLSALALAGTFTVLAIGCAKTKDNSNKETPIHNYTLKEDCDAKPFVSPSPDQDCAVIQEAIASGCAVEKRKAIYEKRCEGKAADVTTTTTVPVFTDKEGTATTTTTTTLQNKAEMTEAEKKELLADDTVTSSSTLLKTIVLDDNKEFVSLIKLSAENKDSKVEFLSAPTAIRCADTLELAKQDVGVILVGDGKLVVTEDLNGETSEQTPAVLVECISTQKEKSKDTLGLTAKVLKAGQSTTDGTLGYTKSQGKESTEGKASVSCHDDATKAALSGKNGIQMLKGTTVLLSNDNNEKMSLISCQ